MAKSYNEKKLTKKYGPGYVSRIPEGDYWTTEEKAYLLKSNKIAKNDTKNDTKNESSGFKLTRSKFSFIAKMFGASVVTYFLVIVNNAGATNFFDKYERTVKYEVNNEEHEISFYNYDYRFKLKQLSHFAPVFSFVDLYGVEMHSVSELNPYDYLSAFNELYKEGAYIWIRSNNWKIADDYLDNPLALYYYDYTYFTNGFNKFTGGQKMRDLLTLNRNTNEVVPFDESGSWSTTNEEYTKERVNIAPFIDTTLLFLSLPGKLTYNMFVLADFILRW